MPVVTISSKGQVVIPHEIREVLGLRKGTLLSITLEGERVVLVPLPRVERQDWRRWRGSLAGTQALQQHLADHAEEVDGERLS